MYCSDETWRARMRRQDRGVSFGVREAEYKPTRFDRAMCVKYVKGVGEKDIVVRVLCRRISMML